MNENAKKYYFSIVKMCCIIILFLYFVSSSKKSLHEISVEWFLLAITLAATVFYELVNSKKVYFLCTETVITLILIVFFKDSGNGLFLLPMVMLDIIIFLKLNFMFSLMAFIGVFLNFQNILLYSAYCVFVIIIYFQKYVVIEKYKKCLEVFEQEEYQLKDSIAFRDNNFKKEIEKNSLFFENRILEEKTRLSQALHDKLGHSINGSIYQLEACKILIDKQPDESIKMVQAVIDNLRTSMDEIRTILRREKPDKKQMALLQLVGLCEECEKKYGIQAEVRFDGENKEIPENMWEVILDNTFEAVTNALKYSACNSILIQITILHKVVRCSIKDNGIGCNTIKEGMGIQGMKNRARKINGFIDLNGEDGFCINMILPIQE
ncbi:sensor histidine kinase [[Clostridium] fimetarium]|uniref:histidine kinase n=1 Tax=[Clostridium] fimetarium TaxID=99656 RepID=A0A1I0Q9E2_9FIRM|nr:histidine kinase [[Clostridium] fimetarium]SEW23624.1 Signal transduction histidine kinase [[Clostridium] fimetarium]